MEERILVKFRRIEDYVEKAIGILPPSFEEYQTTLVKRLALERLLQLAIECVIDICAILVKELHLGPPQNEDHIFDLLASKMVHIDIVKQMKRFRNILVHRYETIDDRLVYQYASEQLADFTLFIQDAQSLLKSCEAKPAKKKTKISKK